MTDVIRVASFDIGKINFAFYIEEFKISELTAISNIPLSKRYNEDGTPTEKFNNILQTIFKNGKTILHTNSNITQNCDKGKKLDPETFHNLNSLLDSYLEEWQKCSVFLIEQQMAFGKKINNMAIKLAQHCYSYFTIRFGKFKSIIDFPSYHKTQILGAPKVKVVKRGKEKFSACDKPARKKWSVKIASEILTERGEENVIVSSKKKDDLADVITQLQAFKYLAFVEKVL
jgi:hypothetical protein